MANSKYIKGSDLMLFIGGKSVAGATNHTLTINAETSEISAKTKDEANGAWNESEVSTFTWEATTENLVTFTGYGVGNTYMDLYDAMSTGEEVTLVLGVKSESGEKAPDADGFTPKAAGQPYLTGKAYITSLDLTAQDGENATFTATFTGNGKLEKTASA